MRRLALLATFLAAGSWQDETPDEAGFRKLIGQLGADFLEDREAARKALEQMGLRAESVLVEALRSTDHRVRKVAVELLQGMKSERALGPIAGIFRRDEEGSVREAAFLYLRQIGRGAEDALIEALGSENRDHRRGAVETLIDLRSEKCAAPMYDLYERERDLDVKEKAFEYLKTIGKPAEPFLLKLLRGSPDAAVRREALRGLKNVRSDEVLAAVGHVFAAALDGDMLEEASDYLSEAGEKAEPHFLLGLKNERPLVVLKSIEGLRSIGTGRAIEAVSEVMARREEKDVRRGAADYLKAQGLKAEGALMKVLEEGNPVLKLLAIEVLGEVKSERPLPLVARMFREDKDPGVHRTTFDYLRNLEARAEKELLVALDDPVREIQRDAILALGRARSEAAIERLVDFVGQLDADRKRAAINALVMIGDKAIEAVEKAAEARRILKEDARAIAELHHLEEVERILASLITQQGNAGYYAGMFAELRAFGREKAGPVLKRIISGPGDGPRRAERPENQRKRSYERQLRELAVLALGELGEEGAVEVLKTDLRDDPEPGTEDTAYAVALYRLGEKKPLEDFVQSATEKAEAAFRGENKAVGCAYLFHVGVVLNRIGRRAESEAAYDRLVRVVAEHRLNPEEVEVLGVAHYNLACLAALRGDKARAMDRLRKAVEAGFRDREWIQRDLDLEGLRGEEGYKALLADEKAFERKPGE